MEIPDFVAYWGRRLCSGNNKPVRIRSGFNSMVFICKDDSKNYIIKGYGKIQNSTKQRMESELQFLNYANQVAPTYVPNVIAEDHERGCLILEHIEGMPYPQGFRVNKKSLEKAAEFLKALNSEKDLAKQIIKANAKEGCMSLDDQVKNIQKRIGEMSKAHVPVQHTKHAEKKLGRLKQNYNEIIDLMGGKNNRHKINEIPACVSPSDFGFHNAIRTSRGPRFIDFEYAGWDKPMKTVLDFWMQPTAIAGEECVGRLFKALGHTSIPYNQEDLKIGCQVYELKWACIILSVLSEKKWINMKNRYPSQEAEELFESRLKKSEEYLNKRFSSSVSLLYA